MRTPLSVIALLTLAGSALASEPSPPTDKPKQQAAAKPTNGKETRGGTLPFEDPLAREKLAKELWITKGVQGGFKTDDLWILQTPAQPQGATGNNEESPKAANSFGNWPTPQSASPNRSNDMIDEDRRRMVQEWERFVFGEPKKDPNRTDPANDLWQRPESKADNPATPAEGGAKTAEPTISFNNSSLPSTPNDLSSKPATAGSEVRFSPFDSQKVPGLRPETWNPSAVRDSRLPMGGTLPQAPSIGLSIGDPLAPVSPNAQPIAPFPPNMNFGYPQNNLKIPGSQQGPVPAPRAHSTDSFIPRQW